MASGPQSRLWKNRNSSATWTPFGGEAVGVAGAVALDQSVTLELAQIVAQLVQTVSLFGEMEGGEDGLVDLLGGPAADVSAAVQENLAAGG